MPRMLIDFDSKSGEPVVINVLFKVEKRNGLQGIVFAFQNSRSNHDQIRLSENICYQALRSRYPITVRDFVGKKLKNLAR